MAIKAKHAFGTLDGIDAALSNHLIDAYDILFVKDAEGKPYVGWIDKNGNKVIVEEEEKIIVVEGESLPESGESGKVYIFGEDGYFWNGEKFVNLCKPTDVTELVEDIGALEGKLEEKADVADVVKLEETVLTKVDATTVQTMIEEHSAAAIEIVEF